jgi:NAD(P)-dependent dehydrogenase (short-subunit alcohol dehydrogenase family)
MDFAATTALVTGANRGFGKHLALELVSRGARVYAAARRPDTVEVPGTMPIQLDITDADSVRMAAAIAGDVNLLINNAGSSTRAPLLDGRLEDIRVEMDTHYFGTLSVVRAFAPVLIRNGGGAVLNVLSVLSWLTLPASGAYCAAKSAEWSLTNALRLQLAPHRIRVTALHVGFMDTDMTRGLQVAKSDPSVIAARALDAVASGAYEILADEISERVRTDLARGVLELYPSLVESTAGSWSVAPLSA